MEKQGVIRPGTTPPERPISQPPSEKASAAQPTAAELDDDFRKRAATASAQTSKIKGVS